MAITEFSKTIMKKCFRDVQVDIFEEGMRDFWKSGPEESRHINLWLADYVLFCNFPNVS